MEHQYELRRIDLNEIPFRATLPLIQFDNIEKLILKKLGFHDKDPAKFPIEKMTNLIKSGDLIGKAILPGGYGGLIGLAAFLATTGIIKIAKYAHGNALDHTLHEGIDDSIHHARAREYDQAIASIKYALDQTEKYTHQGIYQLFKHGGQQKQLIKELKILLKYNLACAYYQSFNSEHGSNQERRQDLDEAIHWLIQVENDIEKLRLRPNSYIRKCSSELLLHKAALDNNDACDAAESGDLKQAKSYLSSAIFYSGYIGYEYRDILRREASPNEPDEIKIRRIIKSNWEAAKQGLIYAGENRLRFSA